MNHLTPHLTNDQIDDLLIGDEAPRARAHVDACTDCATRLAAAFEPLASFNAASLAWSQRRSATLPLQLRQRPAGIFADGRLRVAMGTAVAAVFTLALALPLLHHGSATETAHQAAPQPTPAATVLTAAAQSPSADSQLQTPESPAEAQQIARDNQLLQAIDRELATSETPADLLKMAGPQDANQSSPNITHNE